MDALGLEPYFEGQEAFLKCNIEISDVNIYEINLLRAHTKLPFILPMIRERDGSTQLIYSLKGRLTLDRYMMRSLVHYRDLLQVVRDLLKLLFTTEQYCLRTEQCVMDPRFVYYHMEKQRLEVLYFPVYNSNAELLEEWRHLLTFLEQRAVLCLDPEGISGFEQLMRLNQTKGISFESIAAMQMEWIESFLIQAEQKNCHPFEVNSEKKERIDFQNNSLINIQKTNARHQPHSHQVHLLNTSGWFKNLFVKIQERIMSVVFLKWSNRSKAKGDQSTGTMSSVKEVTLNHLSKSVDTLSEDTCSREKQPETEIRSPGTTLLSEKMCSEGKLILRNAQRCKVYEVTEPITRMGRNGLMCEVVIESDMTIGRNHAEIHKIDGQFYIKDLDSLNGTFVNGERLPPQILYRLTSNDCIRLSSLEIQFV